VLTRAQSRCTRRHLLLIAGLRALINHRFIAPPCLHCPHYTLWHDYCAVYDPAPTPLLLYATHHTILVMEISCKGQGVTLPTHWAFPSTNLRFLSFAASTTIARRCHSTHTAESPPPEALRLVCQPPTIALGYVSKVLIQMSTPPNQPPPRATPG
jgi:hypothetical protein